MKIIEVDRRGDAGEEALIKEARRRQRRRRLAIGAAVVLALAGGLGVAAAVSGNGHPRPHLTAGATGHRLVPGPATAGPPRYYATEESWQIVIRRTATGAVTAKAPNPHATHGIIKWFAMSVAAVAGDREFVAAYTGIPSRSRTDVTRLYSFRLTSAGRVTGLSLVKGGVLTGLDAHRAMDVSPDGSKVALAVNRPPRHPLGPLPPAEIAVINLRTGARSLWKGGLQRPGYTFSIPSISWAADSRSLVFLGQWCRTQLGTGFCAAGPHAAQVRTLGLAGSGELSHGRVLLDESARYPYIVQALLTPGGKTVTMVVLRPPYSKTSARIPQDLRVIQIPLATGEQPRLLYHSLMGDHVAVTLRSDASGRYLLLAWRLNGWIDHGTLRPLTPQGGYAFVDTW